MLATHFGTAIVGGGPAALAPLVSASREGRLDELLAKGIVVIERGPTIGAGRLGDYAIWSDSTAETFLTAVTDHIDPRLGRIKTKLIHDELSVVGRGPIPLTRAADLMELVGRVLHQAIEEAGGLVLVNHEAMWGKQTCDGGWLVRVRDINSGCESVIGAQKIVLATGGCQPRSRLFTETIGGVSLDCALIKKVVQSDEILQPAGLERAMAHLSYRRSPRVAIVGGSTSALAVADLLLRTHSSSFSAPESISILHRRPLRIFYTSAEDAIADGYEDFASEDICPISGFVYRLAGARLRSRDLLLHVMAIGSRPPDKRVSLHQLQHSDQLTIRKLLEEADLIVAAIGYRPRALPLFNRKDERIELKADAVGGKLVDRKCQVQDCQSKPVDNAFGIGLAAGFVPGGALGGEPSFVGQANGLWLWQTAVGAIIVDALLKTPSTLGTGQQTVRSVNVSKPLDLPENECRNPTGEKSMVETCSDLSLTSFSAPLHVDIDIAMNQ